MAFRKNAFRSINFWGRPIRFAPSLREAYASNVDSRYDELVPRIRGKRGGRRLPTNWWDIPAGDYKRKSWKNRRRNQYKTEIGKCCDFCGRYIKIQQTLGDHDNVFEKEWRNGVRYHGWKSNQPKYLLTKIDYFGKIENLCKYCLSYHQGSVHKGHIKILDQEND